MMCCGCCGALFSGTLISACKYPLTLLLASYRTVLKYGRYLIMAGTMIYGW